MCITHDLPKREMEKVSAEVEKALDKFLGGG
jgi:hypothetical protein